MPTIDEVTSRIAELENAKAALLQHAGELEAKRDENSTFENLMHPDSKGHKKLQSIAAELFAIADKVRAFDIAIATEQQNLRLAELAANKLEQRQVAEAAQADAREFEAQLRLFDKHMRAAMDAWITAGERHRSMRMNGIVTSPDDNRFRIKTIDVIKTWLLGFPWIKGGDFGFTSLAGNQRCDFAKVLSGGESYQAATLHGHGGGPVYTAGWLLSIERQLKPYLTEDTKSEAA